MKKLYKSLFISLAASALMLGVGLTAKRNVMSAKALESYQFVEESNALDFTTSQNNATASFAVDNYAVQSGDYLALDIEGYVSGDAVFKVSLNGVTMGTGADFVALPAFSHVNGWKTQSMYGYWLFASGGRGIAYIKLADYFPSVSTISSVDILFSDNKLESFTFHNVFIAGNTTARDGTRLLNVFDGSGNLINANVTNVNGVAITARKSAKGFQTNKSLDGGVSILMPKTHVEIDLDGSVNANGGGYLAYDLSRSIDGFVYFRTALQNTESAVFSADYAGVNGKSLSKNGAINYSDIFCEFSWFKVPVMTSGTVLERVHTATGYLNKIILDCDNLNGGQLLLSNFYFISTDFQTVSPLIDLANMSASERAAKVHVSVTAEGFAMGFNNGLAFRCDDTGVNKPTFYTIDGTSYYTWADLANIYENNLSADQKALLSGGTADAGSASAIEQALARYDYIVGKYYKTGRDLSFTDFMGRNPVAINPSASLLPISETTGISFALIIVAAISAISLCAFFFIKRRKEEK